MTANYIPLDKETHKDLKVDLNHNFAFAKETHLASATIREFGALASNFPIVFIKDNNSENFHTIVMMGLEQGDNLYYKDDRWQTHVLPLSIQRYPFDVRPDGDRLGVFIDENAEVVGKEKGELLFKEDGEATEYLQSRNQMLGDIANSEMATNEFLDKLRELDLLQEITVTANYATGQARNLTGIHTISEIRLNELADDKFLELKKAGYLGAIYAILCSISQINRLVQLTHNTDKAVMSIQIKGLAPEQNDAEQPQEPAAE